MIAIPERYKEEMSIAEALDIVLCEDENLLNCMETIKQTSEVKILCMSDMLTYNAYNVVFKSMSKLF